MNVAKTMFATYTTSFLLIFLAILALGIATW